jgi:Zn finger protein HypA/HybF involved in hydrogenase expression
MTLDHIGRYMLKKFCKKCRRELSHESKYLLCKKCHTEIVLLQDDIRNQVISLQKDMGAWY